MTPRERLRHRLIRRRDRLVAKFHDAIEAADGELDCRELEDGMLATQLWETHVIIELGPRLERLRQVIAALDRLEHSRISSVHH